MGIYGAQRAFFDPFARKFNFGATHFFKPYPFTSKFQSVSSASRWGSSFPTLAPSLLWENIAEYVTAKPHYSILPPFQNDWWIPTAQSSARWSRFRL